MTLARTTAESLEGALQRLQNVSALLGFDGFVDTICHAVDTRRSATEYSRISTLAALGERISSAAGKSTNLELVPQTIKLGGNGPIMANAMANLGVPVTYCGMTGYPVTNQVFRELGEKATLLPIAEPALTDALEFEDGKLIIGKHATVGDVSFGAMLERLGGATWQNAWRQASFVAMVNWTMLPHMTELWRHLLETDSGGHEAAGKTIFFDLADPAKRTQGDVMEALRTLARFNGPHQVILGLNEQEALGVAEVLGLPVPQSVDGAATRANVAALASSIRAELGITTCVVHPTHFAAAAGSNSVDLVEGPFTPQPRISTGAGDHFNAGFCCGRLLQLGLDQSLQCGVATSGYYVRHGESPSLADLRRFLLEV